MSLSISDVIKQLEVLFPKHLAYDKDPIGLHIGNVNRPLTKVLVTLDVTKAVVEEAIERGANLIVAHHPFNYRPLASINTNKIRPPTKAGNGSKFIIPKFTLKNPTQISNDVNP